MGLGNFKRRVQFGPNGRPERTLPLPLLLATPPPPPPTALKSLAGRSEKWPHRSKWKPRCCTCFLLLARGLGPALLGRRSHCARVQQLDVDGIVGAARGESHTRLLAFFRHHCFFFFGRIHGNVDEFSRPLLRLRWRGGDGRFGGFGS